MKTRGDWWKSTDNLDMTTLSLTSVASFFDHTDTILRWGWWQIGETFTPRNNISRSPVSTVVFSADVTNVHFSACGLVSDQSCVCRRLEASALQSFSCWWETLCVPTDSSGGREFHFLLQRQNHRFTSKPSRHSQCFPHLMLQTN